MGVRVGLSESWALKNWRFWTMVLEKTLESPLDCRDPTTKSWRKSVLIIHWKDWCWSWNFNTLATWCEELIHLKKDPNAGKYWRREEKGTTEDEIVWWHHRFDGHEFEQAPGVGDGQGSLACCRPWGCKELDTTEWLNWTDLERICLFRQGKQK